MSQSQSFTSGWSQPPKAGQTIIEENDLLYDCVTQQNDRNEAFRRLYHITFLLRQKLNADVARIIVSYMELYEVYRQRRRPIHPLHIMEFNSPQSCFIGDAVQARARIAHPVRHVVFRFDSKDQGWVSSADSGSWTWFTAGVLLSSFDQNIARPYDQTDVLFTAPGMYHGDMAQNDTDAEYDHKNPLHRSIVREREVFRNIVGCRQFEINTVTWSSESTVEEEAAWVKSLRCGDRIIVRAWAQFAGWQNSIRCTSVSIFNATVT